MKRFLAHLIANRFTRPWYMCGRVMLYTPFVFFFSLHPDPERLSFLGSGRLSGWYVKWYAAFRERIIQFHRGQRYYESAAQHELDESFDPSRTARQFIEEQERMQTTMRFLTESGIHPLSPRGRRLLSRR